MKRISFPLWSVFLLAAICVGAVTWGLRQGRMASAWRAERDAMQQEMIDGRLEELDAEPPSEATECGELNADLPTEYLTYSGSDGFSFSIPYNERWGYGEKIAPFVEIPDAKSVLFGPPRSTGGDCGWTYSYQLTVLPPRDRSALEAFVREQFEPYVEAGHIAEEEIIIGDIRKGDWTIRTYSLPGECYGLNHELVGKGAHFVFSGCGPRIMRDIDALVLSAKQR